MKRHFILLSVAVALILGLLAAPALAQDRPDLLIWADRTRTPPLSELATAFAEEFGVTVEVQELPMGDIRANLSVVGPTGEGPDIIVAAHDWIGELVLNGAVVPIDLGDKAELFTPGSLSLFTYNGELYGMPYAAENVALVRNTDLVPDAPATWDDVRAITEELVGSGAAGVATSFRLRISITSTRFSAPSAATSSARRAAAPTIRVMSALTVKAPSPRPPGSKAWPMTATSRRPSTTTLCTRCSSVAKRP
ncbi:MAG: extracellular solute-binding protein [Chloroflexi bacterium]|nr:extracellular solute-binding protein [Chloroflexota bacterium]